MLALIRCVEHTGEDYNVFTTLARLGRVFPAHTLFLSQLLKSGHIPVRDKELVILRVAWRLGAVYEYSRHLHMARDLGVAEGELDAATTACPASVSDRLAAFLVAADELLADHTRLENTWAPVRGHASDDELLEVGMLVGHT
jgi:alkylhydroperoxidase family enzyme